MKKLKFTVTLLICFFLIKCAQFENKKWVGIHLLNYTSDSLLTELGKNIPGLAEKGINLVFLEVDYSFEFQSFPELRQGEKYITGKGAQQFAKICRKNNIRLIPEFQCLGHQSWAKTTFPLLTKYPELDLTPGAFPNNENIYCREWDPTNPRVNEIVFPLISEIVVGFGADGIHVGMDEIFLLGSEQSPNTKGKDPAALFAQVVNEFYDYFVTQKGLQMFMWGDRLIDGNTYKYGEYEASLNGTAPAVDMIPNDIVICDWHYKPMVSYPSVPMFLEKGFKVLPSSFREPKAVEAFIKYSYSLDHPGMLGHLFTTWSLVDQDKLLNYPALQTGIKTIQDKKYFDVAFHLQSMLPPGRLTIALSAGNQQLKIYYTTDGTNPTPKAQLYNQPLTFEKSILLKAVAYKNQTPVSDVSEKKIVVHKATGKGITLRMPASEKYPAANGASTLVNGINGSISFADGQWLGFEGIDLEALIDFGNPTTISKVSVSSMNSTSNWVHHADHVEVFTSNDSLEFTKQGEISGISTDKDIVPIDVAFKSVKTKYVKILIHNRLIPEGFTGAGNPAWLFVDEIVVE
ncbi:chitobiase/beta-hexosaminidase C-terminal domain-containing protein [candidate division KSB1 bacterium]|nr:chitobiase/beta-hexosaminidase C-terminal domain-containing protein [candidate division KSB1 bacterium]